MGTGFWSTPFCEQAANEDHEMDPPKAVVLAQIAIVACGETVEETKNLCDSCFRAKLRDVSDLRGGVVVLTTYSGGEHLTSLCSRFPRPRAEVTV